MPSLASENELHLQRTTLSWHGPPAMTGTKVAMGAGASRGIGRAIAPQRGRQGVALSLANRHARLVRSAPDCPGNWPFAVDAILGPAGPLAARLLEGRSGGNSIQRLDTVPDCLDKLEERTTVRGSGTARSHASQTSFTKRSQLRPSTRSIRSVF